MSKRMNEITSAIAKREGKGSETSIGNIREICKVLIEMQADHLIKGGKGYERSPLAYMHEQAQKIATAHDEKIDRAK